MRVVSGGKWTTDGRWVVVAEGMGLERIVYDPGKRDPFWCIRYCQEYVKANV